MLTCLYVVLFAILNFVTIDGVNLSTWNLFGMKAIGYTRMAALAVFLSLSVLLFICMFRLFHRKAQKMEAYSSAGK